MSLQKRDNVMSEQIINDQIAVQKELHVVIKTKSEQILKLQAEIARLRYVLATEASYCMGHADKLRGVDPERSARHEARARRLLDAMEG